MNDTTSNDLNNRDGKGNKKRKNATTSRQSLKLVNESGQRLREKEVILKAIATHQPVTSRYLSDVTQIERSNITRGIADLEDDTPSLIRVAMIDKCPITRRRVKYYAVSEWPQMRLF